MGFTSPTRYCRYMRVPLILMMFLVAGPAAAAEGLSLADQASRCWDITPSMADSKFTAKFDVRVDSSGDIRDIAVVSYEPTTAAARDAVRSASKAIEQCSPYTLDDGAGLYVVRMRWAGGKPVLDKSPGLIDPFKPLSHPK